LKYFHYLWKYGVGPEICQQRVEKTHPSLQHAEFLPMPAIEIQDRIVGLELGFFRQLIVVTHLLCRGDSKESASGDNGWDSEGKLGKSRLALTQNGIAPTRLILSGNDLMEHETRFELATHACPMGKRSYSLLAYRSQLPLPLACS
jgi:hypothetical protein